MPQRKLDLYENPISSGEHVGCITAIKLEVEIGVIDGVTSGAYMIQAI